MEIFAQEFKPASYFCDWTCVHLIMSQQKWGSISENELLQKINLSKNYTLVSYNLIILTKTKIKILKLTFEIENWLGK